MKKYFLFLFILVPFSTFAWAEADFYGSIGTRDNINYINPLDDTGYDMKSCIQNSVVLINSPKILVKYGKLRFYISGFDWLNRLPFGVIIHYIGWVSYQSNPNPIDTPYCIMSFKWVPIIDIQTMSYTVTDEVTIFDVWNKFWFSATDTKLLARVNKLTTSKLLHKGQILRVPVMRQ
jgi:hypothetical protein